MIGEEGGGGEGVEVIGRRSEEVGKVDGDGDGDGVEQG
jgi:hypothetical protein